MDLSISTRVIIFILFSCLLLRISWKPLKNKKSHGFYRFFAFEGILLLLMLHVTIWFDDPLSAIHILSWLLLLSSIVTVIQGTYLLRKVGGKADREDEIEIFAFEKTAHLVEVGVYKYIRHPMYASLLFLTWGIVFKQATSLSIGIGIVTSIALLATARIEEDENRAYFGSQYTDYITRTKMFVPFLI